MARDIVDRLKTPDLFIPANNTIRWEATSRNTALEAARIIELQRMENDYLKNENRHLFQKLQDLERTNSELRGTSER